MKSAEAEDTRFILCHLQIEFLQSFWQYFVEPLRISGILKCANKVICISADDGFSFTVGLDHFLEPFVQDVVQVDIRQNRGDASPLRGALFRVP